jgi:hypothetical protein
MQRIGYGRKSKETRHKYKREDDGTRNERGCYMQNGFFLNFGYKL